MIILTMKDMIEFEDPFRKLRKACKLYSEIIDDLFQKEATNKGSLFHRDERQSSCFPFNYELAFLFGCSERQIALGVLYLDRIISADPSLACRTYKKTLILGCLVVAAKHSSESVYKNSDYAAKAQLKLETLDLIEKQCLKLLDFTLEVDELVLDKYLTILS